MSLIDFLNANREAVEQVSSMIVAMLTLSIFVGVLGAYLVIDLLNAIGRLLFSKRQGVCEGCGMSAEACGCRWRASQ